MLRFSIKLPDVAPVKVWGKVIRVVNEGDQVGMGIEFYEISNDDKRRVTEFLK